MQLRYLIGGDDSYRGADNEVVELSYDALHPAVHGTSVKYGNLFNEKYDEQSASERAYYGPYLEQGDTAQQYNEGQIDPHGQGWNRNLDDQFGRAVGTGFSIIELDNPDSYALEDVINAVARAHEAGLKVMAKNAPICKPSREIASYLGHPAVVGVVIEKDCGTPDTMDLLRKSAAKPDLPVWFVAFGMGRDWAERMADKIRAGGYANMGVTYSEHGEYRDSEDVLVPVDAGVNEVNITIIKTGNVTVLINGSPIP
jgi:hypothetical protein